MSSVLDRLVADARRRARADARTIPLADLRREVARLPDARRFEATLRGAERVSLIAEAKRSSPSHGAFPSLGPGPAAVAELAGRYAAAGAAAISVLTEPTSFGGSDDDLAAASQAGLPVLRKDFVVNRYAVWQARSLGADAVLLIVRAVDDATLRELIDTAGEAGIDALVEIHDSAELERALAADATLIGVNARDLSTLDVDREVALPLLRRAAECGATVVAESGINDAAGVAQAAEAGAAAVLVGTSLLRQADPAAAARHLVADAPRRERRPTLAHPRRASVKVCGTRGSDGVRAAVDADADLVGFVLDPRSPRAVTADEVGRLAGHLTRTQPVLVFRSPDLEEVASAMKASGVTGVQLAGFEEPPAWLGRLRPRATPLIGVIHGATSVRSTMLVAEAWIAAGATHVLLDGASRAAGGGSGAGAPLAVARRLGRVVPVGIAGGLRPANVAAAVSAARPSLVDASSGLERDGRSDPARIRAFVRNARQEPAGGDRVDRSGRFGRFGGRFVPETLIPALDDLERAWNAARSDPAYRDELRRLHRDFIGRPTPLFRIPAPALAERGGRGASVWLKREDLAHTGAHKINNAVGQALLALRMGKPRVIAETGAGQHGVATATACALLGLECVVYMGSTDIERQAPNVRRMGLLGAEVRPVTTGNGTLRDALNEALRDWVASVEMTYYILGSAAGPHPYPEMVASLQEVIGVEARRQLRDAIGRVPDAVVACVGGGSNAIGIMRPFIDTATRLIGVEAGGRGDALGDNAASLGLGAPGVLHGAFTMLTQDAAGQVVEPHSVSAGLDYPGVGPQLAALAESGRLEVRRASDAQALEATTWLARTCGIIPALESAHAVSAALALLPDLPPDAHVLVNLSGRGDKDLGILERELPLGVSGADRIRASFTAAEAGGRTALIAYVLSGYPSEADALAAAEAALSGGADMLEIGVPFSDPMADGPTIAEAGRISLAAGGGLPSAIALIARLRERGHTEPLMVMTYLNPLLVGGVASTFRALRDARADGLIVPDLPAGADQRLERLAASCGLGMSFLVAPNTPEGRVDAAIAASTGFVYVVPLFGVTGARQSLAAGAVQLIGSVRDRAAGRAPVAAGFGLQTAAQVAELAPVADGLIVGSALVAAMRDGGPPALGELVATLAAGTARA